MYSGIIDGYFGMDILGDVKATLRNQEILESHGLKPIPIWHQGEEMSYLDYFCRRYELVGIGGIQASHLDYRKLISLFSLLGNKYPDNRFHMLGVGFSAYKCRSFLEPYSLDISTWLVPVRYGKRLMDNGKEVNMPPGADQEAELRQAIKVCMNLDDGSLDCD